MLTKNDNWMAAPEVLIYVAAILIGVPLSMWELWHAGKNNALISLFGLWVPTIGLLIYDFVAGQISKGSMFFFYAWVIVVLGCGVYAYVV